MNRMAKVLMGAVVLLLAQGAVAQLADGLYAAFDTTMGSFTARLDYAEAPVTCANFAGLAEGSQHWIDPETGGIRTDPFYDGLIFHRVMDGFMIQGGCPFGNGTGGPGYAIPDELDDALIHSGPGILSMANSGPDSGGSQFFITLTNTYWLDGKHAVFGEVVDGMTTVSNIGAVATDASDRPLVDVEINHIQVLRVGADAQNFDPRSQPIPKVFPLPLGISNTSSGVVASVVASNLCKDAVYEKATLDPWITWSGIETKYSQTGEGTRVFPAATNQASQFFQGTRIFHPQATTAIIAGHALVLDNASNPIYLNPVDGGTGTCSFGGSPGNITEWGFEPAYCGFYFYTDIGLYLSLDFHYTSPTNGTYSGSYWNSEWIPLAEQPFTDTPPAQ